MALHEKKQIADEIKKLEQLGQSVSGKMLHVRDSAFARFPFLFLSLTTFGLVATFYGFEKLIESVPFFVEHPLMILVSGIAALIGTGTLYKKLS